MVSKIEMVSYSLVRQLQLNAALSAKLLALGRGKSKGEGKEIWFPKK